MKPFAQKQRIMHNLIIFQTIQIATLLGFYHAIMILPCAFVLFDGNLVLPDGTKERRRRISHLGHEKWSTFIIGSCQTFIYLSRIIRHVNLHRSWRRHICMDSFSVEFSTRVFFFDYCVDDELAGDGEDTGYISRIEKRKTENSEISIRKESSRNHHAW